MSRSIFQDKVILVTGGVGSIGSEIVKQLTTLSPKQLRIFDNRETELTEMEHQLSGNPRVRFLLGDVRDKDRLNLAADGVDIVIHAAALKHVPRCEYNPFEAVKTNVYGTQNVIDVCLAHNIEMMVNISTDKVTNTVNTLGSTKLLAERLVASAEYYKGNKRTKFCSVRFGNVVGSRGSVVDLFKQQIKSGGPVTVTHPDMTRYIMSIPQAAKLVLSAADNSKGGEIFILKMPTFKLNDLVEIIIENYSKDYGIQPDKIKIQTIGLRPGERMHEMLITPEEVAYCTENADWYIVHTTINAPKLSKGVQFVDQDVISSSDKAKPLSKAELVKLMRSYNLIQ